MTTKKDYTKDIPTETETTIGHIKKYLYNPGGSLFKVALFLRDDNKETIKITGQILGDLEYVPIEITGYNFTHKQYGESFRITRFAKLENALSKAGLVKFFSSEQFPGIGEKRATEIVETFGLDVIKIIAKDIKLLNKFKFLTPVLKKRMFAKLQEITAKDSMLIKLLELDIKGVFAAKLMNHPQYGKNPYEIIKQNPYALIDEFRNIGFIRADNIAKKLGIEKDDPRRIKALIIYLLKDLENRNGDCYAEYDDIFKELSITYGIITQIDEYLKDLKNEGKIIIEDQKIFLKDTYKTELFIAERLKDLNSNSVENIIKETNTNSNIAFSTKQKEAIYNSLNAPISIITGGPGTGKTTIIKEILRLYQLNNPKTKEYEILLLAPTGRAAKRMNEATNFPASTIHRALDYDINGRFNRNELNPLEAKLIIIDESSMLDIFLVKSLLEAVQYDAQIIFVGDVDQLPSVAAGNFLNDIIESKQFMVVKLTETFRQKGVSNIIPLANDVNHLRLRLSNYEKTDDIILRDIDNSEETLELIKTIVKYNLGKLNKKPSKVLSIDDFQILIPMYKGVLGVDNINREVQNIYISPKSDTIKYEHKANLQDSDKNGEIFYQGDKVIQVENDYQHQIMNGDIGTIYKIESKNNEPSITINFDKSSVVYNKTDMEKIKLAYAITIHKAQGSEYKEIIMPISKSYYIMLKKELIYTGITRAKERIYLLGDLNYLEFKYKDVMSKRHTNLINKLTTKHNYYNQYLATTDKDGFEKEIPIVIDNLKIEDFE